MKEIQMRNAELIPEIIQLLNEGHTITLKLKGYSMRPFLETNRDKALITKAINIKKILFGGYWWFEKKVLTLLRIQKNANVLNGYYQNTQ